MKNSMVIHVIFLIFEFLVVYVTLTLLNHIVKSLIREHIHAFLLVLNHTLRDT